MLRIDIPGFNTLELACLVLDYNGTLACDGELIPGVRERIDQLAARLEIHVLTADTFGKAASSLRAWPGQLSVLPAEDQAAAKLRPPWASPSCRPKGPPPKPSRPPM